MGTIAEKLAYTKQAREEIQTAIIDKGVECPGDAPFCTFDDYIAQISGGGGSSGLSLDDYVFSNIILLVDGKNRLTILYDNTIVTRQALVYDVSHDGNNSLSFNGTSSWINFGEINPSVLTLEVLVKFNAVGGSSEEAYAVAGNWQAGGFGIQQKNGKYACNLNIGGTWYHLYGSSVTIGSIVHLAVTYDGTVIKFYENGALVDSVSVTGTVKAPTASTVFSIGSNPNGSEIGIDCLKGYLYSARLYSAALTESEVKNNFLVDKNRFIAPSSGGTNESNRYYLLNGCTYDSSVWNANANSKRQNSASIITEFFDVLNRTTNSGGCRGLYLPTNGLKSIMFTQALPISGYKSIHFEVTMNPYFTSSYNWAHTYLMLCSSTGMSNVYSPANKIKEAVVWTSAYGGASTAYLTNAEFELDLSDITASEVYLCISHCDAYGRIDKIWLE